MAASAAAARQGQGWVSTWPRRRNTGRRLSGTASPLALGLGMAALVLALFLIACWLVERWKRRREKREQEAEADHHDRQHWQQQQQRQQQSQYERRQESVSARSVTSFPYAQSMPGQAPREEGEEEWTEQGSRRIHPQQPQSGKSSGVLTSLAAAALDVSSSVDPYQAESALRDAYPDLLLPGDEESVRLAYQSGRDVTYLTDRRIVHLDRMGLTGRKINILTVPYDSVGAFAIESAGAKAAMDIDTAMTIVAAGIGTVRWSFLRTVDIFEIQRHLSRFILASGRYGRYRKERKSESVISAKIAPATFLDWFGDNSWQVDVAEVEKKLRDTGDGCVLLQDEGVEMALQLGRDMFLLTTMRLMKIDVQGLFGKKVEYLSILWSNIRAFSVETAGNFLDKNAELVIFTSVAGMGRIEMNLRKGKVDLFALQAFLANKVLGTDTVDTDGSDGIEYGFGDETEAASSRSVSKNLQSAVAWLGDDCRMINAEEIDMQYHKAPTPLLQSCEKVELAFKGKSDIMMFTTKRLVFVDRKGIIRKTINYISIPWGAVSAFGVCSAGGILDKDSELMIWTDFNDVLATLNSDTGLPQKIPRNSFLMIDFQKDAVDLIVIQRYLAERCLRDDGGGCLPLDVTISPDALEAPKGNAAMDLLYSLGGDARAMNAGEWNEKLHDDIAILQTTENVLLAYKVGRDAILFTTARVLIIDRKGLTGKKTEWMSIPYTSIRAFSVESAGGWDADSEMRIFCNLHWMKGKAGNLISQDFRKGKADIIAIQNLLSFKAFGAEDGSTTLIEGASAAGSMGNFLTWFSDSGFEIDPDSVNEKLHNSPPILLADECVDACYRIGRDLFVFSTKRILVIDTQGLTGKKVNYASYPLCFCRAFRLQSASGLLNSAEVTVYTAIPGAASIKQKLSKSASNIWTIQKLLTGKLCSAKERRVGKEED